MSDVDQFPPIIKYDALEARLGRVVGEGGQSQAVALLGVQDQWLAKLYRIVLGEQETVRLDRLIALPDQFSTEDRTLSLRTTSWPVARVADGHDTVGVVISAELRHFREPGDLPKGPGGILGCDLPRQPVSRHSWGRQSRRACPALAGWGKVSSCPIVPEEAQASYPVLRPLLLH